MFTRTRTVMVLVAGLIAGPLAAGAAAQERKDKGAEKVAVEVWTIRATRSNTDISPELKKLAETLKSQFKFTGYKLVSSKTTSVAIGQSSSSPLISPFRASITPQKRSDGKVELKVQVFEKKGDKDIKKLDTTLTLARDKHQLMGGWSLDGGDNLIIAISAK